MVVGSPATQVTVIRIRDDLLLKMIAAATIGPALTRCTSYGGFGAQLTRVTLPAAHLASTVPPAEESVFVLPPAGGADDAGRELGGTVAGGWTGSVLPVRGTLPDGPAPGTVAGTCG
jgi:hypothetical protein